MISFFPIYPDYYRKQIRTEKIGKETVVTMKTSKERGYKSSSGGDINDGIRSASSSLKTNCNRRSSSQTPESVDNISSLTTSTIRLLSIVVFVSSPGVWSFSTPPTYSGKETYAKHHRQQQTNSFVMKIHQQLKQQQHYCHQRPVSTIRSATTINTDDHNVNRKDDVGLSASEQGQQKQLVIGVNDDKDTITAAATKVNTDDGYDGLGEYDPSENLPQSQREVPNVGDPQLRVKEKERSVTNILKELAAIQQQGPQKYCILGTRHCSYLHQQIIELLAYALVLSGNHVYTSGASGTHAATVRGALRAEREDLLTVVLPQSLSKQTKESQELLKKVDDIIAMPQNDDMSLDVASRICNSYLLSLTDQLISFAFHESNTVIEASKEAKALDMLVTTLYLD